MKTKERLEGAPSPSENTSLIIAYRGGDSDAGEELVRLNMPLVYSIASRFRGRCPEFSELIETGTLGLVKAINSFDTERGFAFSTYATPLIMGEIRRYLRDGGIIKVSREQKRLSMLIGKERERRLSLGERADIQSIAMAVGVSAEDAACAYFAVAPLSSLDEAVSPDDDSRTLGETLAEDGLVEREFEALALNVALDKLTPFERKLIILRFYRDMSQVEVASAMGITQVKVSREEKKILLRLRRELS